MLKSLHLRLLQQIVYFSLMILAIIMRRIVERFLGFKIGQIHADKNMVEQGREGWVSFFYSLNILDIEYDINNCIHHSKTARLV